MNNTTEATTESINWKELQVVMAGAPRRYSESLAAWIQTNDSLLLSIMVKDGKIADWPQYHIFAPGEKPEDNTPQVLVDWTGFEEAIDAVFTAHGEDIASHHYPLPDTGKRILMTISQSYQVHGIYKELSVTKNGIKAVLAYHGYAGYVTCIDSPLNTPLFNTRGTTITQEERTAMENAIAKFIEG